MTIAGRDGPLGRIYTLDEAAEYMRLTGRTIAKVARKHGLCTISGRDLLFSESDILAIWDAMRCPSNSPAVAAPNTGTSGAPSADKAFSKLLARATAKSRKQSGSKQKLAY
ncbi:helix-turn-helix domain-containing protein [Rhizobium subbaraonis]|uniref:helix-turn-helix domain-containing protein n=1 Tax=Rhizobium subbaraonis TaxID=908946 RepID=UPI001FE045F6|nr:helix-turn-helix domain-containing protein [Rhizobium subbaraonis]